MIFKKPHDVLLFIRECLEQSDTERLYKAADEETPDFWKQKIFEDLNTIHTEDTLEDVFLQNGSFPESEETFKLGGHSDRTKHLHIDLIKNNNCWRIQKIWKCR